MKELYVDINSMLVSFQFYEAKTLNRDLSCKVSPCKLHIR